MHKRDLDDFDARAAKQVAADKEAYLAAKQTEQHRQELSAFAEFANARAGEASKRGDADDERVWLIASANAKQGKWTVNRIIGADPRIVAHQALRSRLCIEGKTAQIED